MTSIDKHRIPGSVDKHLPDFRGKSSTVDGISYNVDQEVPQDVTSSRTEGTWETNTTGRYLEVLAFTDQSSSQGERREIIGHINSSQSIRAVTVTKAQSADSSNSQQVQAGLTMQVPPGAEYKVGIGTGSLLKWFETEVGKPA